MYKTVRMWRYRLPHWEVDGVWYFITLRCHGSLPAEVCRRLEAIHTTLHAIEPASSAFRLWQRKYRTIFESALDRGTGLCPFASTVSRIRCQQSLLHALETFGWIANCFVIMPNHLHLLVKPGQTNLDLETFAKRLKGRTARELNPIIPSSGRLWQREWYDHWVQDQNEFNLIREYIQNNPVKARLTNSPENYIGLWMA